MTKTFLETGKNGGFIAGLDIDYPARRQASLGERGREEILARDAPENPAAHSGGDAGRPEGGSSAVDSSVGPTCHLMQSPKRQPSSRQHPIDLRDAERQNFAPACGSALEPRDAFPKLGDMRFCRAIGQNLGLLRALQRANGLLCSLFVLFRKMSQSDSGESLLGSEWGPWASNGAVLADCRCESGA